MSDERAVSGCVPANLARKLAHNALEDRPEPKQGPGPTENEVGGSQQMRNLEQEEREYL